eukprot:7336283-Pyramimonas_sp.AAC.1
MLDRLLPLRLARDAVATVAYSAARTERLQKSDVEIVMLPPGGAEAAAGGCDGGGGGSGGSGRGTRAPA